MHALCNMLGDALVPSNVKAGYLARMLARRTLRMRDSLGLEVSLAELGAHHLEHNLDGSGFSQTREGILTILELEEQRYSEMLRAGEAAVRTALNGVPADATEVDDAILFQLAETRGLQPDMAVGIARGLGWSDLSVRVGFSAEMAARHAAQAKAAAGVRGRVGILAPGHGIPATASDFYADTTQTGFSARVLHCQSLTDAQVTALDLSAEVTGSPTHAIVLDRTLFYPDGGGQLGDQGRLSNGATVSVLDTRIEDEVILHLTDGELPAGEVSGEVGWERRKQLMDHHTSVHIIGGSARAVLGPHIWQAGSSKGERYARLDVTHYQRLTRDDLDAIEDHANSIVEANIGIEKTVLDRAEADERYGFELYQGGPPKHTRIRIIRIGEHDVAGETSREHARRQERLLTEASEVLGVQPDDLPRSVQRFFHEWKEQQKRIEQLEAEIVHLRTSGGGSGGAVERDGVRYIILEGSGDLRNLQGMAAELTRDASQPTVAVLGSRDDGGKLLVSLTEDSLASERHDASEVLSAISGHIGGSGGGSPTIAQGGGSNPDGLDAALAAARTHLGLD